MSAALVSPVLVGRAEELWRLLDAYRAARTGPARVVLVGGEAGVGKTRLVAEAQARIGDEGALVLAGGCIELGGEDIPFAPLAGVLRALTRATSPAALDVLLGPARRDLARLLPELDRDAGTAADGGSAGRLFELLLGVLQRAAARQPLMLVMEDLHWADRSTLDLVAYLVRELDRLPVLLTATFRSDELHRTHPLRAALPGWERSRAVERIELRPFSRVELAAQLEAILGDAPEPSLLDVVFERSDGNAFLAEEVLALVRSGSDGSGLPPSLREVLLGRVERLSVPAQRLLRAVSVAGQPVAEPLLRAVAGVDAAMIDEALREAVDHGVLVVGDRAGFVFRHALAREAVDGDMLPGERMALHRAYAVALETGAGIDGAEAATLLAHHWSAAGDLARALRSTLAAAEQAAATFAPAEALRHLERAVELWPQVPGEARPRGSDLADVLARAAGTALDAGEPEHALRAADAALAEAGVRDGRRRALLLEQRSRVLRSLGRHAERVVQLQEALSLLPDRPASREQAVVLRSLAAAMSNLDLAGTVPIAERAVAAAAEVGAVREQAMAEIVLGTALTALGSGDAGLGAMRTGLVLAEQVGDVEAMVLGRVNLADALTWYGRPAEAAEVARAGLELAAAAGLSGSFASGALRHNLAEALVALGRWDEAEQLVAQALESGLSGMDATLTQVMAAYLDVLRGRHDAAAERVAQARALHKEWAADTMMAFVATDLARARGDLDGARATLEEVEWGNPVVNQRYSWPLAWLGLRVEAELAAAPAPAPAGWSAALRAITATLPVHTPPARAWAALAAAETARIDGTAGVAAWQAAVDRWREAPEPYPLSYALLRLAEARLLAGERAPGAAALREAAALAGRVGAVTLVAEAQRLSARGAASSPASP